MQVSVKCIVNRLMLNRKYGNQLQKVLMIIIIGC